MPYMLLQLPYSINFSSNLCQKSGQLQGLSFIPNPTPNKSQQRTNYHISSTEVPWIDRLIVGIFNDVFTCSLLMLCK